jgi:DNA invertase Pin-like site-specific DNA recombinase
MTNTVRLRAVIYARVSGQIQKDANTIASQLRVLPEYVRSMGWELVGTYIDDGCSADTGKLEKRGDFNRMLADAKAGKFDVVVIIEMKRLTRTNDWRERGEIMGTLQRAGVKIATPSNGLIELGTSVGDIVASLHSVIAAEDNRSRVEACQRGAKQAALRGSRPGGCLPYGLTWTPGARDKTGWGIHTEQANTIQELFRRCAFNGESARSVGMELERRGVRTARGGRWRSAAVAIINSPVYRGEFVVRGTVIEVPRLVDDATWYAAQAGIASAKLRGLKRTKYTYLCESLATCAVCSSPMGIQAAPKPGRERWRTTYYVCSQRREPRGGLPRCTLPFFQCRALDERLWAEIETFLAKPREEILARLNARRRAATDEAEAWTSDFKAHTKQLEELEAAESAVLDRFTRKLVSEAAMDRYLKDLAARRAMLQRQIETARTAVQKAHRAGGSTEALGRLVDTIKAKLAGADEAQRKVIVAILVRRGGIVVGPEGLQAVRLLFADGNPSHRDDEGSTPTSADQGGSVNSIGRDSISSTRPSQSRNAG